MTSHPIIFSGESVRAILRGAKTQTRRVVKPQPVIDAAIGGCRYRVGDELWVKEPWQAWTEHNKDAPADIPEEVRRINYLANGNVWDAKKRSAQHMPAWASRLTLRITDIRVQRVQEISEEDAKAEGFKFREHFIREWDALNLKRGFAWDSNPWVWAITFEVVKREVKR